MFLPLPFLFFCLVRGEKVASDSRKPQSGEEEVRLRLHFFAFGCVCIWFAFIQILRTNGSFGSWIAGTC